MKLSVWKGLWIGAALALTACTVAPELPATRVDPTIGRVEVFTMPLDPELRLNSATYTPSGKVLVSYYAPGVTDRRELSLAVMDDDGRNRRPVFSGKIPEREHDNGVRFMVFADNRRVFLGDFVLECLPDLDDCRQSQLVPVEYPAEVASGSHISHRWSEMLIAPDNVHVAWTTLFASYSAAMFTGKLLRQDQVYRITDVRIVSTLEPFREDPDHPGGVLPNPVRNGEVKQFVRGGAALSLVGAVSSDLADSVVQDLHSGELLQITRTPGYDETTIFSPDERLGIVMSSRFSSATDLGILGLLPKPYPASLNMGLNMHAYTYAVTGVRQRRSGNVGPALIDIAASRTDPAYSGVNLHTQEDWVFRSPMSWHPDGTSAMWLEGQRGAGRLDGKRRIQVVRLPDYQPQPPVPVQATPNDIPYAQTDLSVLKQFLEQTQNIDVRVYGKASGYIHYQRGARGEITKTYVDYSEDGSSVYRGTESTRLNPRGNSVYRAQVQLDGPRAGAMDMQLTFGPLSGALPAKLIFVQDASGRPQTFGYSEYDGVRLTVDPLTE